MKNANETAPKDTRVVGTSFTVSISDVLINSVVAMITGSVTMLSQALQGLSDLLTTGLLYRGVKVSKRKRDDKHHFGYGRELFFWVIIAGVFMFLGTGLLSVYFGLQQIKNPQPLTDASIAIFVLFVSLVANAYAFSLSVRRLRRSSPTKSWLKYLRSSSMIETKSTFLIDFLGTLAAIVGLISITTFIITGNSQFDGVGGLAIGGLMMVGSILIIADVKGLIVGRAVSRDTAQQINLAALSVQHVERILDLRTTYIGSARLLIIIEVHLDDRLTTNAIEIVSDEIKLAIKRKIPQASIVQVEVETPDEELKEQ